MKLAIVGSGKIVTEFLAVAADLPQVELAAIVGRPASAEKLATLSAASGIGRVHTDYAACLADPEVDTVYLALPNHLHYEYARDALRACRDVICEKPFTTSLDHLRHLRTLAEANGLVLVEAITTNYLSTYAAIAADLPRLGDLAVVSCVYAQRSSRYDDFVRGNVHSAFDPASGGGALMDIGIYNVHFVVGLLGRPVRATYLPNVRRGVDTSGVLTLDYGDCTAVCVGAKDSDAPNRQVIQGDRGTIVVDGATNTLGPYTLALRDGTHEHVDRSVHPHRMYEEFRAFAGMVDSRDLAGAGRRLDHSEVVLDTVLGALDRSGIVLG